MRNAGTSLLNVLPDLVESKRQHFSGAVDRAGVIWKMRGCCLAYRGIRMEAGCDYACRWGKPQIPARRRDHCLLAGILV